MKKVTACWLIVACLSAATTLQAQISNAGFETWSNGAPTGWMTDNAAGLYTPITQTSDAHSGSSALHGAVVTYSSVPIAPVVWTGFPWTSRSATFSGYFKFTSTGGDSLVIAIVPFKNNMDIGAGYNSTATSVSSYTQFNIPIMYRTADTPDSVWIALSINPPGNNAPVHVGSTFTLDDVALSGATGVETTANSLPATFALDQNYPNPFNPTTTIGYELPSSSNISLHVFDVLGREVVTLVNTHQAAGHYSVMFNGSNLPSGMYFYRLTAGTFSQTKRLLLVK